MEKPHTFFGFHFDSRVSMVNISVMNQFDFQSQGHAEDVVMRHRFLYYVLGKPVISDVEYDQLERVVLERWPVSVCSEVGSSEISDYPLYIREGRRPNFAERQERDEKIARRWLEAL